MKNHIMRVAFLLNSLCLVSLTIFAQSTDSTDFYRPVFALKFMPLSLLNSTPALQFAAETKTFQHQAFHIEYGHIVDIFNTHEANFNGFRFKGEYRFYQRSMKGGNNFFWGIHYMRKHVNLNGNVALWRQNFSYQEIKDIHIRNRVNAFYIVGGFVFPFSESFWLETTMGLGRRVLNIKLENVPEDAELDEQRFGNTFFIGLREGKYRTPGVFISFRVNYILSR